MEYRWVSQKYFKRTVYYLITKDVYDSILYKKNIFDYIARIWNPLDPIEKITCFYGYSDKGILASSQNRTKIIKPKNSILIPKVLEAIQDSNYLEIRPKLINSISHLNCEKYKIMML